MQTPKSTIELLLDGSGQFNQLVWQTRPTMLKDASFDVVATIHEWSHHELNNVTSYGLLLMYFAFLARHAEVKRDSFEQRLKELVVHCETAHETYATWYSIELLTARYERDQLLSLLPDDYKKFHARGERLVEGIQSPFLRQQAFLTQMRSCFDARAFVEFDCDRADEFRLAEIRGKDFPDRRLELIAECLSPMEFTEWTTEFCTQFENEAAGSQIRTAITRMRHESFFDNALAESDATLRCFLNWLTLKTNDRLSGRGIINGPPECHLNLTEYLVSDLNRRCPSTVSHRLVASKSPHDTPSVLLLQMESEIVRLRDQPLQAELIPIAALPNEIRHHLAVGTPLHIVLQVRTMHSIYEQHNVRIEQPEPLERSSEPVVFLRRRSGEAANIFVFESPSELKEFREATKGVPAYGIVSSVLLKEQAWIDQWLDSTILWAIKIDGSLHTFLMHQFSAGREVRYDTSTLRDGDRVLHFLSFLVQNKEEGSWGLYLGFCGEQMAKACLQFIEHKMDSRQFIRDSSPFAGDLSQMLSTLATHLLHDEYFFSFNQLAYS